MQPAVAAGGVVQITQRRPLAGRQNPYIGRQRNIIKPHLSKRIARLAIIAAVALAQADARRAHVITQLTGQPNFTFKPRPLASWRALSAQANAGFNLRSEEHTSELQSRGHLVCRLLLEKKKKRKIK